MFSQVQSNNTDCVNYLRIALFQVCYNSANFLFTEIDQKVMLDLVLVLFLCSINKSKPVTPRRQWGTPTDASAVMAAIAPVLCNAEQ